MATDFTLILYTLLFTLMLVNLPILTSSDDTCPYPCYPPPTGGGATPSPPSSGTGNYPTPSGNYPPPAGNYPPPTTGNFPYNPSPPFGNNYYGPPPPDPILPYFPFYYRKPPHQTADNSWAPTLSISTLFIALANSIAFFFLF